MIILNNSDYHSIGVPPQKLTQKLSMNLGRLRETLYDKNEKKKTISAMNMLVHGFSTALVTTEHT